MKIILAILLFATFFVGCFFNSDSPADNNAKPKLIGKYELEIPEPSGLALDFDGSLWTVSDKNEHIYHMDSTGNLIDKFDIKIEDLEGITQIDSFRLAVVSESKNLLVILNKKGEVLAEEKIKFKNKGNSGFEGITWDPDNNLFYVLNEKNPGVLIMLNEKMELISEYEPDELKDYSGICYVNNEKRFWIVSDESKKLIILDNELSVIIEFKFNIPQMEGVAVDLPNNRLYIVSDAAHTLFVYDITKI